MTLQQLRYFIETVNSGSINKAAERLFIAQSSLSNALKDLETEIQHQLFIRTPKGISLTTDGGEFLGYARQVLEQTELLEERWLDKKPSRRLCSISTQHYAFAVNAFVNMVKKTNAEEYEYTLREARTFEIVEDVKNLRSDLGILYMSQFNRKVIEKLLYENNLNFHSLFHARPHVFISAENPLAAKPCVTLEDLADYPRLSFEQGEYNSFYFSEEILSTEHVKKDIRVGDRATIFNLMIGLNGYTISTGIVSADLNGEDIIAVPLKVEDTIEIGWISHKDIQLSRQASLYLEELKDIVSKYSISVSDEL
ncbi:LysR family transcriptional regulator [Clostridium sp. HBUAS56010]|uniref:LysR family transcriptional regulator n=1 Tax=Clostridium sp. HBUAS56010 TaxID=2571127 RepID=UPI001177E6ED|nr:LysR family transcriptional regulator [Clostridium sp. HBUAS56010]